VILIHTVVILIHSDDGAVTPSSDVDMSVRELDRK